MVSFFLGILASFGTIGAGAFMVAQGRLDYGTVMAVVSLQMDASFMVQSFGGSLATFSASLVRAGRVFDFLELDCETERTESAESENTHIVSLRKKSNPIEIENLTFSYGGQPDVLHDFSMEVMDGEKIMVMGESGRGKSTLLKLLLRFYPQDAGKIKLYGHDIEEYPLCQLRQLITYIPQDNYLFEGSIYENIACGYTGKGQVSDAQVRHRARIFKGFAHSFDGRTLLRIGCAE